MAGSEVSIQSEIPRAPYFNAHFSNSNGAFVPMIADCMANGDGKEEGDAVGFHSSHGECVLKVETCPLQNPIDLCSNNSLKSDGDTHLDLSPEGPKEDSNALFDSQARDMFRRGNLGPDLEIGKEISDNGGSFWSSTMRLPCKDWNRFIRRDFVQSFNGSIPATRTEESFNPKMALAKPTLKSANPNSKRGENPRNIGSLGLENMENEKEIHKTPMGNPCFKRAIPWLETQLTELLTSSQLWLPFSLLHFQKDFHWQSPWHMINCRIFSRFRLFR